VSEVERAHSVVLPSGEELVDVLVVNVLNHAIGEFAPVNDLLSKYFRAIGSLPDEFQHFGNWEMGISVMKHFLVQNQNGVR